MKNEKQENGISTLCKLFDQHHAKTSIDTTLEIPNVNPDGNRTHN